MNKSIKIFIMVAVLCGFSIGIFFLGVNASKLINRNNTAKVQTSNQKENQQISVPVPTDNESKQRIDKDTAMQLLINYCDRGHEGDTGEKGKYKSCGDPLLMNYVEPSMGFAGLCCLSKETYGDDYYVFVAFTPFELAWVASPKVFSKTLERSYNFEKLKVIDVDVDGIDEVTWEEGNWTMGMRLITSWIYSLKYDDYFYKKDRYAYDFDLKDWKITTSYSDNFPLEFTGFLK